VIERIDGGKVTVRRATEGSAAGVGGDLEAGRYVVIVRESPDEPDPNAPRLLQANVTRFSDGVATLEQSREVAGLLKRGSQLVFFAVHGGDDLLAAAPELALVQVDERVPSRAAAVARRATAANNVKQIILAMHDFHDIRGVLPPAVVFGPDGEPWHSWRILILPFIEEAEVYNQYKFDEPWNGPNNSKLLDKMPDLYRDPAHGDDEGHFTHFAAITGEGMAFTAEGTRFDGKDVRATRRGGRRMADFLNNDGATTTLMFGPVSPEREIPWLKPEDVVVDEAFPGFDNEVGFAAPHAVGDARYGVFGFADASVVLLPHDLDLDVFRLALTFNDGNAYEMEQLRSLSADPPRRAEEVVFIEYEQQDGEPVAILRIAPAK